MSRLPSVEIQQKIYELLRDNSALNSVINGIYDTVPDEFPYPFLVIGSNEILDNSTNTADGFKGFQQIDVWDQGESNLKTKQIQGMIYDILNNVDLELANFPTVKFRCELSNILTESDNRTKHGIQRFNFILGGNDL